MGKRYFEISLSGWAVIELDDQVIDVVDDDWRSQLYNLRSPEEIAAHVAYNLLITKWPLSKLDGWADQPNENAVIVEELDADLTVNEISKDELMENQS